MEEYTINEDGEIVRGSNILSTERIIVLLNTYQKLDKNKQRIIDIQKEMAGNDKRIIEKQETILENNGVTLDKIKKRLSAQ